MGGFGIRAGELEKSRQREFGMPRNRCLKTRGSSKLQMNILKFFIKRTYVTYIQHITIFHQANVCDLHTTHYEFLSSVHM